MLGAEAATGSSGKRSEAVGTECRHSNWRARAAVGVQCRDRPLLRADRVAADTGTHCRGLQAVRDGRRATADVRAPRARTRLHARRSGTLMALSTHNVRSACAELRQLAADHLAVVRAKIADLKTIEGVLADAVLRYDVDELPADAG